MNRRRLLAAATFGPAAAHAQPGWRPDRPVRLISAFSPGSTVDLMARALATPLGEILGQPVVVENRAGAGGNIGVEAVARAPKDGHAMTLATSGALAINPTLLPTMPYDVQRDLAPVSLVGTAPNVLLAAAGLPVTDLAGLLAFARAAAQPLTFGSSGTGSSNHLAGELFALATGLRLVHIPYRGNAEIANDLAAGQIQLAFSGLPPLLPLVEDGRIRALAVCAPERLAAIPTVPTLAEAGVAGAEAVIFYGLVTAAGTPAAAVAALSEAVRQALARPALATTFARLGAAVAGSTPAAFGALIAAETALWQPLIRRLNLRPN